MKSSGDIVLDEVAVVCHDFCKSLCIIADKYGLDRNEVVKRAIVFTAKTSDGYDYKNFMSGEEA